MERMLAVVFDKFDAPAPLGTLIGADRGECRLVGGEK